jgi:hypothetical protein
LTENIPNKKKWNKKLEIKLKIKSTKKSQKKSKKIGQPSAAILRSSCKTFTFLGRDPHVSNLDRTIGLAGREENVYLGPERTR